VRISLSPQKINLLAIVSKEFYFIITGKFSLFEPIPGLSLLNPSASWIATSPSSKCISPLPLSSQDHCEGETPHAFWQRECGQDRPESKNSREATILLYATALDKTLRVYAQLPHLWVSRQCIKIYSTR